MKYFKDQKNNVFAYSDEDLKNGKVLAKIQELTEINIEEKNSIIESKTGNIELSGSQLKRIELETLLSDELKIQKVIDFLKEE